MKKVLTPDSDWQRIWFAARNRDWTSMAIVASEAGADVQHVAEMLAKTGQIHGERPVRVVRANAVRLEDVERVIDSVAAVVARSERAIVPVDPIADNPAAIAVVRACSVAVLVVRLGDAQMAKAQSTVEIIGRDRLLGSVVLEGARGDGGASQDHVDTAAGQ